MTEPIKLINHELLGAVLRIERKRKGYTKAEELSKAINACTGLKISQETIYKIEQGKQKASLDQLAAICAALYGEPFPESLFTALSKCIANVHDVQD